MHPKRSNAGRPRIDGGLAREEEKAGENLASAHAKNANLPPRARAKRRTSHRLQLGSLTDGVRLVRRLSLVYYQLSHLHAPSRMTVSSNHRNTQIAADEQDLANILTQRDTLGGAEFWLADQDSSFPCLVLIVSGSACQATYFPAEEHPGFRCLRPAASEPLPSTETLFVWAGCDPATGEWVPSDFVVPVPVAFAVAHDFFRTRDLPSSAQWFEL